MSASTVIPMPASSDDFEDKCLVLFGDILRDPNIKSVGVSGMAQSGLDLLGAKDRDPQQPVGVQCKLRTKGDRLSAAEARTEVEAALKVTPALTEYYIATTAPDDPKLDALALELRQEQAAHGRRIDIQIWGWRTLQQRIRRSAAALDAFDPGQSPLLQQTRRLAQGAYENTVSLVETGERLELGLSEVHAVLRAGDTARGAAFEAHLDADVDRYRDLMNDGKPRTALVLLQALDSRLDASSSAAIRARVRANMGVAHLRLGDERRAGELLLEARVLNPGDPKARANAVLGLVLTDQLEDAFAEGVKLLEDEATRVTAAGYLYQAASSAHEPGLDPDAAVPEALREALAVSLHRINWLRVRGDADWRGLALAQFESHPDDSDARRQAAEALLDEVLDGGRFARNPALTADEVVRLRRAAELLEIEWDRTRSGEAADQPTSVGLGANLVTTFRALSDHAGATRCSRQLLEAARTDPLALTTAAYAALDEDRYDDMLGLIAELPPSTDRSMHLLNGWSRKGDWGAINALATTDEAAALRAHDGEVTDTILYRARWAQGDGDGFVAATEALLAAWPDSVTAHVIAADELRRRSEPERLKTVTDRLRGMVDATTTIGERLMAAQLWAAIDDPEAVIDVLDGYVPTHVDSEPLACLAWAFAKAPTRPQTRRFFRSLPGDILKTARYSRLAGRAEAGRGDLAAAERHLKAATAQDRRDLTAHLLLHNTLMRANRREEAVAHVRQVDETAVRGSALQKMQFARLLMDAGETDRALKLAYGVARGARDQEEVAAAYPMLILLTQKRLPLLEPVNAAAPGVWFDLEGLGVEDVQGVIEEGAKGPDAFAPDHALAVALHGAAVGDEIELAREIGEARRYRLRALKPKHLWLMHDIMRQHGTRFPDATSMIEIRVSESDISPILDVARHHDAHRTQIQDLYLDLPLPLALVAELAGRSAIELAEQLPHARRDLKTCVGTAEDREAAATCVQHAQNVGAVLDTLTLWTLYRLDLIATTRDYFGRLLVPRSSMDEVLKLRHEHESRCGQEYMTLGFEGEQPTRTVISPEESDRSFQSMQAFVTEIERCCEVVPTDGTCDPNLKLQLPNGADASFVLDPVHLAKAQDLLLLSDDLHLRQLGGGFDVDKASWLQVALAEYQRAGLITAEARALAVGQLCILRHGYVSLDAETLLMLLGIEGERGRAFFTGALEFLFGSTAEVSSHLSVALGFLLRIFGRRLEGQRGAAAASELLSQVLTRRRSDGRLWLRTLEIQLDRAARTGDFLAAAALDHLRGWMRGHFLQEVSTAA